MFKSFYFAGFECATGLNKDGQSIDQIAATQHDRFAREDYAMIAAVGLQAAREGVRWPLVDLGEGRYDFSTVAPFVRAAREYDIEVIWDLFHYGYPEGLDLFSPEFPKRFAEYCYAAARYIAPRTDGTCYFTPINEPSFFAWAAGHAGLFGPHQTGRGEELKRCLIRAAIAGIDAIRTVCPRARIVNVDPICRVAPALTEPQCQDDADHFNHVAVFESWDMLAGRLHPELGGSLQHLDITGINYYWTNQWEVGRPQSLIQPGDPRYTPLSELVRTVWLRYGQEVMITETGHRDDHRAGWVRELARECDALLKQGVPLRGVCLYPILGMPEWHAPDEWTRMGLWDLLPEGRSLKRAIHTPTLVALQEAQG